MLCRCAPEVLEPLKMVLRSLLLRPARIGLPLYFSLRSSARAAASSFFFAASTVG